MKLKKNDEIIVTAGKDKGKRGKIEKIFPQKDKVLVGGLNLYKKHLKASGDKKQGGIIDIGKPLPVANVSLICPKCNKQVRIGFKFEGKEKMRICHKCNQVI